MALDVAVYEITGHHRSQTVCQAMMRGINRVGDRAVRLRSESYRAPDADVAVFYGYTPILQRAMVDYRKHKRAVYIDLGYFGRHEGGRRAGFHKVVVNSRHPNSYFQSVKHPTDRIDHFGINIEPWKDGRHILIAGMSAKAAKVEGFEPEEWERKTITALQAVTDRPIIYRPKPNWKDARPINGVGYSNPNESLGNALSDCHAVVTHHSNVAIDGIISGIPAFAWDGVAKPMGLQKLSEIEKPLKPEGREQWLADIAYTQWTVREMAEGAPWRHLKNEGLIP